MLTGENGILTQKWKANVEIRGVAVEKAKDLWESNKNYQVFNVDTSTTWRVLEIESSGSVKHLLLVSESQLKSKQKQMPPLLFIWCIFI